MEGISRRKHDLSSLILPPLMTIPCLGRRFLSHEFISAIIGLALRPSAPAKVMDTATAQEEGEEEDLTAGVGLYCGSCVGLWSISCAVAGASGLLSVI